MDKHVFIINGYGGVGKDSFCSMVAAMVPAKIYSSVECIKQAVKLLGCDPTSKDEKTRKYLSDLKMLSTRYNDYPCRQVEKVIDDFMEDEINEILFVHVREPRDIARFVREYPEIKTILVTNSNVDPIMSNEADASVALYPYDITIDNSESMQELQMKAVEFVDNLR